MERKNVREIPANPILSDFQQHNRKLNVAAYCRVSTEEEEQQNSFNTQVNYYTEAISSHKNWHLAGIFADEGITGVRIKKRVQFNEMIAMCKKKKIDLILTKSISRFARNTLDCIKHVRILKSWGIPVIFEKENIDTSNMTSEMILTCLSAFAQAESESISGNVTKGIRMGYKQGKFSFRYTNFLGYKKGEDGKPEIVPDEAATITMIAQSFLNGDSLIKIRKILDDKGIPTATGKLGWSTESIMRILENEKYMGDVLLQKSYTSNFLEGKIKKNNGTLPQYYIQDNHPAIIPREMFFRIQEEIARRKSKKPATQKKSKTNLGRYTSKYALSERLVCGDCGCYYRRATWSIHGRKQIVWRCINRLEFGKKYCANSPSIPEETLHSAIFEAIQLLISDSREEISTHLEIALAASVLKRSTLDDSVLIERKLNELNQEFNRLLNLAGDENEFIDLRIKQVTDEIHKLQQGKIQEKQATQRDENAETKYREIIELLSSENLDLAEYSDTLVYRIIERIAVLSKEEIRIRFVGGDEMIQPLK